MLNLKHFIRNSLFQVCLIGFGLFFYTIDSSLANVLNNEKASTALINGDALFSQGKIDRALNAWVAETKRTKSNEQLLLLYQRMGSAYQALGDNLAAIRHMIKAQNLAAQSSTKSHQYRIQANLGSIYLSTGQYQLAKTQFEASLEKAALASDLPVHAEILNEYGGLLILVNQYQQSLERLQESEMIAQELGMEDLLIRVQISLATLAIKRQQKDNFIRRIENAQRFLVEIVTQEQRLKYAMRIGELLFAARKLNSSDSQYITKLYTYLQHVLQKAKDQSDDYRVSKILGIIANLYFQNEQYQDAATTFNRAVFAAQEGNHTDLLYRWQWQLARLADSQNNTDAAARHYRQAKMAYQELTPLHTLRYLDPNLSEDSPSVFFYEYADVLLRYSGQQSDKKKISTLLIQARDSIEQLKSAELQDYFRDSCVADMQARNENIGEYSESDALILYPILFDNRLELLVSFKGEISRYTTKLKREVITDVVFKFRTALETRRTRNYLKYATQLYRWIIKPIESLLQHPDVDTLVVIPDLALRTLPIAALHDGAQFLVSKLSIVSSPGLNLTARDSVNRASDSVLIMGLTEPVQGYPALYNVDSELENIHKLFESRALINEKFRSVNVQSMFDNQNFTVAHFATHAEFGNSAKDSFILTYDDKIGVNELSSYIGSNRFRSQPIDLITLSACSTAAGDDRAALGMAGITVKAGARSALATLWRVNDRVTSELMSAFYAKLKEGDVTKAQALQFAQKKMLGDKRYRHPGLWSPFLLIGSWK